MKLLAWPILLAIAMAPLPLEAQTGRVVLVLDGSNSMWGRIDGTEKIVVARDVLTQVLADLPADLQIGLAAYGHRQEGACDDIEMLLPVGDHDRAVVARAIRGVQPRGMTPITGALQLVADGLEDADGPTHLVLVSDGKETCEGDPCALVRTLRERGVQLTVHVVGFDVTKEEGAQLQCIAKAGGGLYAGAGTAGELTAALSDIRQTVVEEVAARGAATETAPGPGVPRGDGEGPSWRLDMDGESHEGRISFVRRVDGRLAIQLVNDDAVNMGLLLPGDGPARRDVAQAFFVIGRGKPCGLVASDPPFHVRLEASDGAWLSGTFAGALACPDFRLVPVNGSFHIPTSEE